MHTGVDIDIWILVDEKGLDSVEELLFYKLREAKNSSLYTSQQNNAHRVVFSTGAYALSNLIVCPLTGQCKSEPGHREKECRGQPGLDWRTPICHTGDTTGGYSERCQPEAPFSGASVIRAAKCFQRRLALLLSARDFYVSFLL